MTQTYALTQSRCSHHLRRLAVGPTALSTVSVGRGTVPAGVVPSSRRDLDGATESATAIGHRRALGIAISSRTADKSCHPCRCVLRAVQLRFDFRLGFVASLFGTGLFRRL